jgi:hypothetical protein
MKCNFNWLFIAAASIIVLCSCNENNSKKDVPRATLDRALLVGNWQLHLIDLSEIKDSSAVDPSIAYMIDAGVYKQFRFSFTKDGAITETVEDRATSGPYQWRGDSALMVWEKESSEIFRIIQLDTANLALMAEDTVVLRFKRIIEK